MKRIVTCTFEFTNTQDFRKVIAVYRALEDNKKGSWELTYKIGIKVIQYLKLDNYELLKPGEVTCDMAMELLKSRGFLVDR